MAKRFFNVRVNEATGEKEYFFPMEIENDEIKAAARSQGLNIGMAKLGFRVFEAVMVPCVKHDPVTGNPLPTSSEEQYHIYKELIKDEMNAQEEMKEDGRCQIPDGKGGVKRCPCRIPNPEYKEGNGKPKTLPVRCEGCIYEQLRNEHTTVTFTTLGSEDEDGELVSFEPANPTYYNDGDRYERIQRDWVAFVAEKDEKLKDLAELLSLENTRSEAAREIGIASSTAQSQREKLKILAQEFIDTLIPLK